MTAKNFFHDTPTKSFYGHCLVRVNLCGMCILAFVSFHIVFYLRGGPMARVSWNFVMYCLCICLCVCVCFSSVVFAGNLGQE